MKAKKSGTPVNETLKRRIKRNMQRGIWGSKEPRGRPASCDGPTASMTGIDLGAINPNGYTTLANGAWAWHVAPDIWFERWVPKPNPNETHHSWVDRILPVWYTRKIDEDWVAAVNACYAHRDWASPKSLYEILGYIFSGGEFEGHPRNDT